MQARERVELALTRLQWLYEPRGGFQRLTAHAAHRGKRGGERTKVGKSCKQRERMKKVHTTKRTFVQFRDLEFLIVPIEFITVDLQFLMYMVARF